MTTPAISVEHLSKRYRIGHKAERNNTFGAALANSVRAPIRNLRKLRGLTRFDPNGMSEDVLWALDDVSFSVQPGEAVGIIGRNGSGKSTLLKIVSRITEPTTGRVTTRGRVSSLLEVGTGFHPELTGRENIYLNGTILGMSKIEIDRKFDEIVEFSGVERFIDTPVKRYSSGMKVRLAFSVAAHLEPEILIIDEVLAVGDAEFQAKCLGKMGEVAGEGRTVLFVSHNMNAITDLVTRAVLLNYGSVVEEGDVESVVSKYHSLLERQSSTPFSDDNRQRFQSASGQFTGIRLFDSAGNTSQHFTAGQDMTIAVDYSDIENASSIDFSLVIFNQYQIPVTMLDSRVSGGTVRKPNNSGTASCVISKLPLPPGRYRVEANLFCNGIRTEKVDTIATFDVVSSQFFESTSTPPARWCSALFSHRWDTTFARRSHNRAFTSSRN